MKQAGLELGKRGLIVQINEFFDRLALVDVMIEPGWCQNPRRVSSLGLAVPQLAHLIHD